MALVIAVVGGAIYWFFTLPVTFAGPEGYEVSVPHGWEVRPVEGGMTSAGPLDGKLWGTASASYHPFSGRGKPPWPDAALAHFGVTPDEYKTGEPIDGKPAVILVFTHDSRKFVAAVVDGGEGLVAYRIGCALESFAEHRPLFDSMVRRIRCVKR